MTYKRTRMFTGIAKAIIKSWNKPVRLKRRKRGSRCFRSRGGKGRHISWP